MADNRYTFIAVPDELTESLVLKRFLDKLVQQLDVAFNNRGKGGFIRENQLDQKASLSELVDVVNNLPNIYVTRKDPIMDSVAAYTKSIRSFSPNELINKKYMLAESTKNPTQPTISDVVAGENADGEDIAASIANNRNKINEILDALRAAKIISV